MAKSQHCKCKPSCLFTSDKSDSDSDSDADDPIKLYCRIKPLRENFDPSRMSMVATKLLSFFKMPESNVFTTRSSQKDVFQRVGYPLLKDLLAGQNSALFFYGTSESGKSYTLLGEQNDPGILPRIVDTLFNSITQCQAKKFIMKPDNLNGFLVQSEKAAAQIRDSENKLSAKMKSNSGGETKKKRFYQNDGSVVDEINNANVYAVFLSYVLIHNGCVYDLLDRSNRKTMLNKVIKPDIRQKMYVENLVEIEVVTSSQAHELYIYGFKRKRTFLEEKGSEEWKKAHSIFNIRVVQLPKKCKHVWNIEEKLIISQMSLVDLAGMSTDSSDQNIRKSNLIENSVNHSILSLRVCMHIFRNNYFNHTKTPIPCNDSKLTLYFKDFFNGEGSLNMILCVNPALQYYEEVSQAMLFANIDKHFTRECNTFKHIPSETTTSETATSSKQASNDSMEEKVPVVEKNFENVEASDAVISRLIKILNVNQHSALAQTCEMKYIEDFRRKLTNMKRQNIADRQEKRYIDKMWKKRAKKGSDSDSDKHELQELGKDIEKIMKVNEQKATRHDTESAFWKQKMEDQHVKLNKQVDENMKSQRKKINALVKEEKTKVQRIKAILKNDDLETVQSSINDKLQDLKRT